MPFTKVSSVIYLVFLSAVGFGGSQISPSDDSLKTIEKVYLNTDRTTYFSGEDVWFKTYLIDASERLLSEHSKNLQVELISPSSDIIYSHILKISKGLSNGDFHLSDTLRSGGYCIRVLDF